MKEREVRQGKWRRLIEHFIKEGAQPLSFYLITLEPNSGPQRDTEQGKMYLLPSKMTRQHFICVLTNW